MFKFVITISVLCAVASAGYIGGYEHVGHGLSYSGAIAPTYYQSAYVPVTHYVKTYSAPIVHAPVVKTITPVTATTYKTYKIVETSPVHAVPVVYSPHSYSGDYGIH